MEFSAEEYQASLDLPWSPAWTTRWIEDVRFQVNELYDFGFKVGDDLTWREADKIAREHGLELLTTVWPSFADAGVEWSIEQEIMWTIDHIMRDDRIESWMVRLEQLFSALHSDQN